MTYHQEGKAMDRIVRTETEIYEILDWARDGQEHGSHYPGASYEDGIEEMYRWLIGEVDDLRE